MTHGLFIFNARLLDEAIDGPGAILVIEGKIRTVFQGYFTNEDTAKALAKSILNEDGCEDCSLAYYDAHGLTVTPSFIDMHVHFRYPGQTQKEDLNSGLHAAIAGGFGTVVTMPNTNPVVSSVDMALQIDKEASAFGLARVIQTVSITKDFEGTDISHLDELDGHFIPVITEDGHDVASAAVMLDGMTVASKKGIVVSCHCEDNELAKKAKPFRVKALDLMEKYHLPAWGGSFDDMDEIPDEVFDEIDSYLTRANDILALAEDTATARNIAIARLADCHVHLAHVSTANAIECIRNAKNALAGEYADYADDEAVLAKAYYGAGNIYNLLSDMEQSEKYCQMSVQAGKNSGNTRCQVLSTIMLGLLKLNQMNDALAADYIFYAFSLAIKNQDDDVMNTIYTLLAQIFETAESYESALEYHQKGIDDFAKTYPQASSTYLSTYGARILCKGICCISAKEMDEFINCYQKLVDLHFEDTMPVYRVSMIFMKGIWHYAKGEKEQATQTLSHYMEELSNLDEIMDTYELLTHCYNVFEEYQSLEYQKKAVEMMKHYSNTLDVWKCREQCNRLEIRYYKQVEDKDSLFTALEEYYALQQEYRDDYMKQRRANFDLRKHIFEEEEQIRYRISTLEEKSQKGGFVSSLEPDEEIINDMLREFKVNCLIMGGNEAQSFKIEQDTEFIAIPAFNLEENSELDIIRKSEKQKRREKYNRNKNPSRAKKKKELQELIDEYEEEL